MLKTTLFVLLGLLLVDYGVESKKIFDSIKEKQSLVEAALKGSFPKVQEFVRKRRSVEEVADSSEEAIAFMSYLINLGWESDKLGLISGFAESVLDSETNITIIGWQQVLGDDGKVKEINSIEIAIPAKPAKCGESTTFSSNEELLEMDDFERTIPTEDVKELREVFEPLAALGIPAKATFEDYDTNNELLGLLYLDEKKLYITADNFTILNKTIEASPEQIEEWVSKSKGEVAVWKYDVDGKFLKDASTFNPLLWGGVIDFYEPTDDMLLKSPTIMAHVQLEHPKEEIPKELASRFKKEWPEYKWRVLIDAEDYYVNRDVAVTLDWDNVDFYEDSDISYFVYGVKK